MVVGACVVGETEHIGDTVITQTVVADALCGKVGDVGIHQSTGLVFDEFSFVFEGVLEGFLIAYMLIVVEGASQGDNGFPGLCFYL